MALYIAPSSKGGSFAVAICDRCKMKMNYDDLVPDGNSPGLRVCKDCRDPKDVYRLPARTTENIALRYPRKDETLE